MWLVSRGPWPTALFGIVRRIGDSIQCGHGSPVPRPFDTPLLVTRRFSVTTTRPAAAVSPTAVALIAAFVTCVPAARAAEPVTSTTAKPADGSAKPADGSTKPADGSAKPADGSAKPADALPATVRVVADHTYLRAGPGDDFYPTERLAAGAAVEVWAVDPSGAYVAVRPVAGSFSWLRGCDLDRAADAAGVGGKAAALPRDVGVVVTDGAVSRIGSQLNELRHVAQVTLEAGERVRVLEEVRIPAGRHAGLWVRIEPPAGEFRWARLADLETPPGVAPPPAADAAATADGPPASGATVGEAVAALRDASVAVAQAVGDINAASAAPPPVPPPGQPVPPPQPLGFMPSAKRLFSGWLPRGSGVFDPAAPVQPVAVSGAAGGAAMGTAPLEELSDIDLALSVAVTGDPASWNLEPVRERLRRVAAHVSTDAERSRVEALDARIARFEGLQGRHRTLAAAPAAAGSEPLKIGGMWTSLSTIGSRPIRPGVLPGGGSADGQPTWTPPDVVETTGRLATVVSRRPDAPRWAIVDQHNNVVAFIAPQTGVNLAPLVGQDVSVRGARGYMPEYKRPYVVASEARMRMAASPEATPDRATR